MEEGGEIVGATESSMKTAFDLNLEVTKAETRVAKVLRCDCGLLVEKRSPGWRWGLRVKEP